MHDRASEYEERADQALRLATFPPNTVTDGDLPHYRAERLTEAKILARLAHAAATAELTDAVMALTARLTNPVEPEPTIRMIGTPDVWATDLPAAMGERLRTGLAAGISGVQP